MGDTGYLLLFIQGKQVPSYSLKHQQSDINILITDYT